MPAPVSKPSFRPDSDIFRVPNLSEWLGLIGTSDASVWATYVDFKSVASGVRK